MVHNFNSETLLGRWTRTEQDADMQDNQAKFCPAKASTLCRHEQ